MGFLEWISDNWFSLLQSIGIIAGLFFSGLSFRHHSRSQKIQNLFRATDNHYRLWRSLAKGKRLSRLLQPDVDLAKAPLTVEEEVHVNLITVHLASVWESSKEGFFTDLESIRRDVEAFYTLPIPKEVWSRTRMLRNKDFREFVESCLPLEERLTFHSRN